MREKLLGDHENTARSHQLIGNTYAALGNFACALEPHKRALLVREKVLGDNKDTTDSHQLIGDTYAALGNFAIAPLRHPRVHLIGSTYFNLGDY